MPDLIDNTQEIIEFEIELLVKAGVECKNPVLATGHCLNCDAPLEASVLDVEMRWCDHDCRDDWQKRIKLAR